MKRFLFGLPRTLELGSEYVEDYGRFYLRQFYQIILHNRRNEIVENLVDVMKKKPSKKEFEDIIERTRSVSVESEELRMLKDSTIVFLSFCLADYVYKTEFEGKSRRNHPSSNLNELKDLIVKAVIMSDSEEYEYQSHILRFFLISKCMSIQYETGVGGFYLLHELLKSLMNFFNRCEISGDDYMKRCFYHIDFRMNFYTMSERYFGLTSPSGITRIKELECNDPLFPRVIQQMEMSSWLVQGRTTGMTRLRPCLWPI